MTRTINIIDPALVDTRGHHFDWNKRLHDYYSSQGYAVRVYCNVLANREVISSFSKVSPVFTGNPYRKVNFKEADELASSAMQKVADEFHWFLTISRAFESELKQVQPADYQLFTTAFDYQVAALSSVHLSGTVSVAIHFPPNQRESRLGTYIWASAIRFDRQQTLGLRYYCTTPEVQRLYKSMYGLEVQLLPHIYDVQDMAPERPQGKLTVGFLGQQRAAKGISLIPAITKWLVRNNFSVICQDSSGKIKPPQNTTQVEVLGFVDDLPEVVRRCDLVVAPYNPAWYLYNMAGVIMESLSCGVPVIAPQGSSSGNLVESLGAGTTFEKFTSDSVIQAIAECAKTYDQKKQHAIAARELFKNNHGVAKFAEALIPQ